MRRRRLIGSFAVAWLTVVLGCGPRLSDTGYTGTWTRRGLSGASTLAIVKQGDDYIFRVGRSSDDGKLQLRCDWDGECEESYDGEQVATYRFSSWIDEESGRLRLECRGQVYDPDRRVSEVHYVDEFVVRAQGTRLVSHAVAKNGQALGEGNHGKRIFEKRSDSVVDPPKRSQQGG